jgi:hypothetical protein
MTATLLKYRVAHLDRSVTAAPFGVAKTAGDAGRMPLGSNDPAHRYPTP